ncbi:MAG: hypothetical protein HFH49_12280 [Lachnospiraceae bacterium]|nr:hypothetical protein [Lachnospiraceae bacterium]
MDTNILFEPIQIGNVELKNRIAMSPMNMGYTGPLGYAGEQTNAWYAARARGGFGLIITECMVANPFPWRGSESLNPLLCDAQDKYRHLSQLAEVVHSYRGAKIFAQVSPGWGRQGHPMPGHEAIAAGAPSAVAMEMDMRHLTRGWALQFKRVSKEAGLDPVFRREWMNMLYDIMDDECSILFATHLTEELEQYADAVTMLSQGRQIFSLTMPKIEEQYRIVRGSKAQLDFLEKRLVGRKSMEHYEEGLFQEDGRELWVEVSQSRPTLAQLMDYLDGKF